MSQIIDFVGPTRVYASVIAANSPAVACFRGGASTVVSVWSPVDTWDFPLWSNAVSYAFGATVNFTGHHYAAETANIGQQPGAPGSMYWTLLPRQPVALNLGLDPEDAVATQSYVPFAFGSGSLMQVKGFNAAGAVDTGWTTISSGVAFSAPNDLCLLGFVNCQPGFYTGTTG